MSSVKDLCRSLQSDKKKERTKALDELKQLLSTKENQKLPVDKYTLIVRSLIRMIKREKIELVGKDAAKTLQLASDLKRVLEVVVSNDALEPVEEVVALISEMSDDFLRALAVVLPVRKYRTRIQSNIRFRFVSKCVDRIEELLDAINKPDVKISQVRAVGSEINEYARVLFWCLSSTGIDDVLRCLLKYVNSELTRDNWNAYMAAMGVLACEYVYEQDITKWAMTIFRITLKRVSQKTMEREVWVQLFMRYLLRVVSFGDAEEAVLGWWKYVAKVFLQEDLVEHIRSQLEEFVFRDRLQCDGYVWNMFRFVAELFGKVVQLESNVLHENKENEPLPPKKQKTFTLNLLDEIVNLLPFRNFIASLSLAVSEMDKSLVMKLFDSSIIISQLLQCAGSSDSDVVFMLLSRLLQLNCISLNDDQVIQLLSAAISRIHQTQFLNMSSIYFVLRVIEAYDRFNYDLRLRIRQNVSKLFVMNVTINEACLELYCALLSMERLPDREGKWIAVVNEVALVFKQWQYPELKQAFRLLMLPFDFEFRKKRDSWQLENVDRQEFKLWESCFKDFDTMFDNRREKTLISEVKIQKNTKLWNTDMCKKLLTELPSPWSLEFELARYYVSGNAAAFLEALSRTLQCKEYERLLNALRIAEDSEQLMEDGIILRLIQLVFELFDTQPKNSSVVDSEVTLYIYPCASNNPLFPSCLTEQIRLSLLNILQNYLDRADVQDTFFGHLFSLNDIGYGLGLCALSHLLNNKPKLFINESLTEDLYDLLQCLPCSSPAELKFIVNLSLLVDDSARMNSLVHDTVRQAQMDEECLELLLQWILKQRMDAGKSFEFIIAKLPSRNLLRLKDSFSIDMSEIMIKALISKYKQRPSVPLKQLLLDVIEKYNTDYLLQYNLLTNEVPDSCNKNSIMTFALYNHLLVENKPFSEFPLKKRFNASLSELLSDCKAIALLAYAKQFEVFQKISTVKLQEALVDIWAIILPLFSTNENEAISILNCLKGRIPEADIQSCLENNNLEIIKRVFLMTKADKFENLYVSFDLDRTIELVNYAKSFVIGTTVEVVYVKYFILLLFDSLTSKLLDEHLLRSEYSQLIYLSKYCLNRMKEDNEFLVCYAMHKVQVVAELLMKRKMSGTIAFLCGKVPRIIEKLQEKCRLSVDDLLKDFEILDLYQITDKKEYVISLNRNILSYIVRLLFETRNLKIKEMSLKILYQLTNAESFGNLARQSKNLLLHILKFFPRLVALFQVDKSYERIFASNELEELSYGVSTVKSRVVKIVYTFVNKAEWTYPIASLLRECDDSRTSNELLFSIVSSVLFQKRQRGDLGLHKELGDLFNVCLRDDEGVKFIVECVSSVMRQPTFLNAFEVSFPSLDYRLLSEKCLKLDDNLAESALYFYHIGFIKKNLDAAQLRHIHLNLLDPDPDGFYVDEEPLIENKLRYEANWTILSMLSHSTENSVDMLQSELRLGKFKLMPSVLQDTEDLLEIHYEAAWRCSKWDLDEWQIKESTGVNSTIFHDIQAIKKGHLDGLKGGGLMFDEIIQFASLKGKTASLINSWDSSFTELSKTLEFGQLEKVLALRIALLETEDIATGKDNDLFLYNCHLLLSACFHARKQKQTQLNANYWYQLDQLTKKSKLNLLSKYEHCKLLWQSGEQMFAISKCKALYLELSNHADSLTQFPTKSEALLSMNNAQTFFKSKLLSKIGLWVGNVRAEPPASVISRYFQPSIELLERNRDESRASKKLLSQSYHRMAQFSSKQYRLLRESEKLEHLKNITTTMRHELNEVTDQIKTNEKDKQLLLHKRRIELQLLNDLAELKQMEKDKMLFLSSALESFCQSLYLSDKYDFSVYRLVSIWLQEEENDEMNDLISKKILMISAHKFICLIYQLTARLSSGGKFQSTLYHLLGKILVVHPYHSAYQLLALVHSNYPEKTVSNYRAEAASKLLQEYRSKNPRLGILVPQLDTLCTAYNQLAYFDIKANKSKQEVRMESSALLLRLKLNGIPIPTREISIDRSGKYSDLVFIQKFASSFHLVGGINQPKKIECYGSDGQSYRQLVKGRDDLRQDAVLEQVFCLVNLLLEKHIRCRRRNLQMRTFKVIPLSSRSGVLAWVDYTRPIGDYLNEAHKRYHPKDLEPGQCRELMRQEFESPKQGRLQVFRKIIKKFSPAMKYFFLEKFPSPHDWFSARLKFTRSTAVASMLGFVLGLGDRHSFNILIDEKNASVIHIDLGIAFDMGKLLSCPETVPFRLTQDIVDGMGTVEGAFRKCSIEVLRVLRTEKDVVWTILDVLRYDPLYNWEIPGKESQNYHMSIDTAEKNGNKHAERALRGVWSKLTEEMSVECHVNELIRSATSDENLSSMYHGWQAWM